VRIVAGQFKGRRLYLPKNINIRPTTDFAKESLFNILNNKTNFDGIEVLDLFSGTGSIAIEFISRGVKDVIAIEKNYKCIEYIKTNIDLLNISNLRTVKMSVFDFLDVCTKTFDVIFADPPYDNKNIPNIITQVQENKLLKEGGILVLEHSAVHNFSKYAGFVEERKYGSVHFSFFESI